MQKIFVLLSVFITLSGILNAQIIAPSVTPKAGEWLAYSASISLADSPKDIELRIAADSKYWLWVNSELQVIEGALKRGPNHNDTYCDVLSDGKYGFDKGVNDVAILVWYFGKDGFSHRNSPTAGMSFEIEVDGKTLQTNSLWRVAKHAQLSPITQGEQPNYRLSESNIRFDARESFDFINLHSNSVKPNLDEQPWQKPVIIDFEQGGWGKLVDRPIPQWRDYGIKSYKSVRYNSDSTQIIAQLPYNCHVTPYFKIKASAGDTIDIRTDNYRGGSEPNVYAQYITRDGEQEFECLGWMNGHEVVYSLPKGVELLELGYRETGYDSDFAGSFVCDNMALNTLWSKAQRTLYVTMRDTYMDCPDRERAQWWGDVVNELYEAFYALDSRAHLLTRKGVRELMDWQRKDGTIYSPVPSGAWGNELPMQMLASVGYYGFWSYYMGTGDKETIEYVFNKVKKYLDVWQLDDSGFVVPRAGGWTWGDWGENKDMYLLYQLWYLIALDGYKEMANLMDEPLQEQWAQKRGETIRKEFHERYWQGTHYQSPDYTALPDDRAQALAVVAGVAPKSVHPELRKFFKNNFHASPYMEKYVLESLCMMGYYQDAMDRMQLRYGAMIESPLSTLWEGWGIGGAGFGGGSYNHAWSGGPLTVLSSYIAGIRPITPAFESFLVNPNIGNLNFINAVVPMLDGQEVRVSINHSAQNYSLDLWVPKGRRATVAIPNGYSQMTINGKLKENMSQLDSGNWEIEFLK